MENAVFRTAFLARLDETGLSITDVAARAGLPYDRVYNIKKRETASTAVETALAIAHSFGMTVEEFIDVEGTKIVATPSDAAKLVEDSALEVLIALTAGQVIKTMSIPVEQASALIRGVWQRRSQRPGITAEQIHSYLADELDLLTGGKATRHNKSLKALSSEGDMPKLTPPEKLN